LKAEVLGLKKNPMKDKNGSRFTMAVWRPPRCGELKLDTGMNEKENSDHQ